MTRSHRHVAAPLLAVLLAAAPVGAQAPESAATSLRDAIEAFVRERAPAPPRAVEIPSLEAFLLPEFASARAELSASPRTRFVGRVPVTVVLREGGRELKRGVVTVTSFVPSRALVAARQLSQGTRVEATDVRLEKRELAQLPDGWIARPERALGQRLRRGVRKGQPLRERWLEEAPSVARGQIVRLLIERGALRIEALGEARADGRDGEWIRVVNRDSHRELRGRVVSEGVVRVEF